MRQAGIRSRSSSSARSAQRLAGLPPDAPLAVGTSVAGVYLLRFRSLPPRTRDVLVLAAAIDGGEVSVLARAAPMLGLDLSDLIPAEAAALITVHDSRVEFRHPLARSAIYGDCRGRTAARGAPRAGRRLARRRCRPPRLASRARLVRSR